MEKVTEHTIEHLAKNTSHVLLDNGVMTLDCDYKKVAGEGKIRFDSKSLIDMFFIYFSFCKSH